jgi:hypothetical protein
MEKSSSAGDERSALTIDAVSIFVARYFIRGHTLVSSPGNKAEVKLRLAEPVAVDGDSRSEDVSEGHGVLGNARQGGLLHRIATWSSGGTGHRLDGADPGLC